MKETSSHPTDLQNELRIARSVWDGFRQDLITDAFALRPLPLLAADGAFVRRLPGAALRERARRLPHLMIGLVAFWVLVLGVNEGDSEGQAAFASVCAAIPIVMTLFRPVGAWWLSVGATLTLGAATDSSMAWPWTAGGGVAYLTVMAVVAARSRPRVAAEMWLITVFIGFVFTLSNGWRDSDSGVMVVLSTLLLMAVWTIRSSRTTKRQAAVTEVERSRRTVLEERTTIARELHDVVAHHMSVIAIQAEAAPYRVSDPPEELTRSFAIIRENAVIALTELRRVLGVVRAEESFADAGPEAPQPTLAALDSLLANVRDAGLDVDKAVTGAVRTLPQGVELSAYRIIQEALSNALRHAPGAPARVEISYVPVGLGLRVVNGPPTDAVRPSPGAGHGLLGMRERAAMLGGEVTAEPTDEGGYEVVAFLPVTTDAV